MKVRCRLLSNASEVFEMFSWLISRITGLGGSTEKDPLTETIRNGRGVNNELQSIQRDLAKDQTPADASGASGLGDAGSGFSFGDFGGIGGGFDAG